MEHYNEVRLHSAIGYITPSDELAGRDQEIWKARDRKLEEARELRRLRRRNVVFPSLLPGICPLPAGEVHLEVDHRELGQLGHRLVVSPTMPCVELQNQGVRVAGRVVDATSGRAIADAFVWLKPED